MFPGTTVEGGAGQEEPGVASSPASWSCTFLLSISSMFSLLLFPLKQELVLWFKKKKMTATKILQKDNITLLNPL